MTQRLRESLDLAQTDPESTISDEQINQMHQHAQELSVLMSDGADHSKDMEVVFNELLGHARDLMAFGYNVEHTRARGIFEIAGTFYSHVISAKNAKREAQLKAMRLALDKRKVDLDERRTNHVTGQLAATMEDDGRTIVVEDRNDLLRRLRQQVQDETKL